MSYKLGFKINGDKIEDDDGKIISLLLRGLSKEEIEKGTYIKVNIIYNRLYSLYGRVGTEHCVNGIMYEGTHNGFDYNFCYEGKEIFTKEEKERLFEKVPRLKNEKRIIIITRRIKK